MFSSVSVEESGINTRDKKAGQGQFERILRLAWHTGLPGAESDPATSRAVPPLKLPSRAATQDVPRLVTSTCYTKARREKKNEGNRVNWNAGAGLRGVLARSIYQSA
jgi:hypothetical protein